MKDRRAGISNITKTGSVSFYTVPPLLKKSLSILSQLPEDESIPILYGVIIAKDIDISKFVVAGIPAIAPSLPVMPISVSQGLLGNDHTMRSINNCNRLLIYMFNNCTFVPDPAKIKSVAPVIADHIVAKENSVISSGDQLKAPIPLTLLPSAKNVIQNLLPKANAFVNVPSAISATPISALPSFSIKAPEIKLSNQLAPILDEKMRNTMLKVANFCATKGLHSLQTLKEKEESRTLMPFLFEENPGYAEFNKALDECMQKAQKP